MVIFFNNNTVKFNFTVRVTDLFLYFRFPVKFWGQITNAFFVASWNSSDVKYHLELESSDFQLTLNRKLFNINCY